MSASSPLLLAVPSKGRLHESCAAFFARAGLPLTQGRGARDYRGAIAGLPDVEVLYLSAAEIARELAQGGAHIGVTGEDLIREQIRDADTRLELLAPLGFGPANVVVAVPQAWIDVRVMADLDDVAAGFRARHGRKLRVATKYVDLTRDFFARRGIADYRIVESLGATEGAPASGAADLIVDITTTGATLAANALKILDDGVILRSEANLVASVGADWTARARAAAGSILARVAAEEEARVTREIRAHLPPGARDLVAGAEQRFSARLLEGGMAGGPAAFQCPASQIFALAEWLIGGGAGRVAVAQIAYVFTPGNPLAEKLEARIGPLKPPSV